jgi:disulfide oxidoreductase YuzD
MLSIKILGPGCYNCYAVEQAAVQALETIEKEFQDLEATVQHIEDPLRIQEYPILFTPGLVVNEKLVCAGRIPSKKEIVEWLRAAINQPA